jgi:hypothetical protein
MNQNQTNYTFLCVCVCGVVKGRPKCSQQEVQLQQDGPLMSIPSVVEGFHFD